MHIDKNKNENTARKMPLVVDLDGTLTPSDTLIESIFCLLKINPLNVFRLILWLMLGRAGLKQRVSQTSGFSPANLPLRIDFVEWLKAEREGGRMLILATAANATIANAVAQKIGLFDSVIASDSIKNMKGTTKLAAIEARIGGRFAYAGDSKADMPIWFAADAAVLVAVSSRVGRKVRSSVAVEKEFPREKRGLVIWFRAIRIHQWIKNLLVFVPLFTTFTFNEQEKLFSSLFAFFAFCLAASATYIFNDLWDLNSDREHPRKRNRPFASGTIPLLYGVMLSFLLFAIAFVLALSVSTQFTCMLLGYVVLTTVYSWTLKQYVLIDVIMLAMLYTFRVLAGSVAIKINATPWLLAFSIFTFFSLALVKRCAELQLLSQNKKNFAHGRDYQISDLVVLWPLGIGASLCSVVIFGLYIGSPGAASQYGNTSTLWLVGIGLLYWHARAWIKTARGEMHDDPIVFSIRDFGSRVTVLGMIIVTIAARFLEFEW